MQVDVLSGTVPRVERWYALGIAVLSAGSAAACCLFVPAHVLDFDMEDATEELNAALSQALGSVSPDLVCCICSCIAVCPVRPAIP